MGAVIDLKTAAGSDRRRASPSRGIIGQLLEGKWRVISPLAEGGMGSVFLAEDVALEREVAVKFLSSRVLSNPEATARFEREAKVMAQLDHPNLVPILSFGHYQGLPFIVMKRLRGEHLRDWVKVNGHPPLVVVRELIGQLCDGLEHLHRHGVVHRDIKPNNIVVGPDRQVTLLDFGVARPRDSEEMTPRGSAVGSPRYMAPEQIVCGEVDCRADLYSVGVVLYELVTGAPLYAGSSDLEVLHHHVETAPPDPASQNPAVSRELAAVILRALAKAPAQRFSSAAELKAALVAAPVPLGCPTSVGVPQPRSDSGVLSIESGAPEVAKRGFGGPALARLCGVGLVLAGALTAGWVGWSRSSASVAAIRLPAAPSVAMAARSGLTEQIPSTIIERRAPEPNLALPAEPVATASERPTSRRQVAAPKSRPAPVPPPARASVTLVTLDEGRAQWAWCDVDGKRVGCSPLTVSLEPGHHAIVCAHKATDKRGATSINVVGGRSQTVTIHLE